MALDKSSLLALIAANLPDNSSKSINAKKLRDTLTELVNSDYNLIDNFDLVRLSEHTAKSYRVGECVVNSGVLYQANQQTSTTFILSEWDDLSVDLGTALNDFILKENGIELVDKKKVVLSVDGSINSLDTGIYSIEASGGANVGLDQEYPASGKGTLKVWKGESLGATVYEYISDVDPSIRFTRNLASDWIDINAKIDNIIFTSGLTRVSDEVFLGGNVSDVNFQGTTANSTVNFNDSKVKTTRGFETTDGTNSFKLDSASVNIDSDNLFIENLPLDNNLVGTNKIPSIDPTTGKVTLIDSQAISSESVTGATVYSETIDSNDWIFESGVGYNYSVVHNFNTNSFLIETFAVSGGTVLPGETVIPQKLERISPDVLRITVDDNTLQLGVVLSRGGIETINDASARNGLTNDGDIVLGGTLDRDTNINGTFDLTFTGLSQFRAAGSFGSFINIENSMTGPYAEISSGTGNEIILNTSGTRINSQNSSFIDMVNGIVLNGSGGFNLSLDGEASLKDSFNSGLILDTSTDILRLDDNRSTTKGLEYGGNYSSGFTTNSLINKGFIAGGETPIYSGMKDVTFASSVTLDCSINDNFKIAISGNITINLSNFNEGQTLTIDLAIDNVGGHTVTLSSDFEAYDNVIPVDNSADKLNTIICKVVGNKVKYLIQTA